MRASAWDAHAVPKRIDKGHLGRASVKKTAPQPCCVVPCEPVGRAGDKPDICRDPHVRWAQSGAGVATDRPEKGA